MKRYIAFVIGLLLSILCNNCVAQPAAAPSVSLEESLSEEVNDPTASHRYRSSSRLRNMAPMPSQTDSREDSFWRSFRTVYFPSLRSSALLSGL